MLLCTRKQNCAFLPAFSERFSKICSKLAWLIVKIWHLIFFGVFDPNVRGAEIHLKKKLMQAEMRMHTKHKWGLRTSVDGQLQCAFMCIQLVFKMFLWSFLVPSMQVLLTCIWLLFSLKVASSCFCIPTDLYGEKSRSCATKSTHTYLKDSSFRFPATTVFLIAYLL